MSARKDAIKDVFSPERCLKKSKISSVKAKMKKKDCPGTIASRYLNGFNPLSQISTKCKGKGCPTSSVPELLSKTRTQLVQVWSDEADLPSSMVQASVGSSSRPTMKLKLAPLVSAKTRRGDCHVSFTLRIPKSLKKQMSNDSIEGGVIQIATHEKLQSNFTKRAMTLRNDCPHRISRNVSSSAMSAANSNIRKRKLSSTAEYDLVEVDST